MEESITVLKSNFLISVENVNPALKAVKNKYPALDNLLKQDTPQLQFQFAMHLLGWHVRIHGNGMIFGLHRTNNKVPFISAPSAEFFELIAPFTQIGSYVNFVVNGVEKKIELNPTGTMSSAKDLIDYLKEQEVEMEKPKPLKIITEDVAQEIANEIVPDVTKTPEKTMADLVAEAMEVASDALNTTPEPVPITEEPVKKTTRARSKRASSKK